MLNLMNDIELGTRCFMYPHVKIALSSQVIDIGHEIITSEDYCWNGLKRGSVDMAIWQYTISGGGRVTYRGKEYRVRPGQAMLLRVPEDHCYYFDRRDGKWEFIYISISGREAMRLLDPLYAQIAPVCTVADDSKLFAVLKNLWLLGEAQDASAPFTNSKLAYEFLMTMFEEAWRPTEEGSDMPDSIYKVMMYCLNNIGDHISVDEMAKVAGISRFHFSRLFLKAVGMSPAAYLSDLRMKYAVRLFQTQDLSVKEVALECSYSDISYFCKVFRKEYGVSPGQFKDGVVPVKKD